MSDWEIVVPEATTNFCLNPSGEIAGNFAAVGGGTHTRVTTAQFFDVYSYRIQTVANNEGGTFTLQALTNNIHFVTMRVSGTLPAAWDWSLDNAAYTAPVLLEAIDGVWSLYGLEFPAAQANGSVLLYVRQNGAGAGDFNIDGIQVEQKTYWTTFCDGTRQGCEWNGAAHASTSQRSAVSRAGGLVQDLQDDYNFEIGGMIATGMPAVSNAVDSYAILPGGELNSIKVESRIFTLTGVIRGTSLANLHANRQALLDVLKPNAVPDDAEGPQPVRLRYTGAAVHKQIAVHYEAGLETRIEARIECWERLAVRFLADDPYWYEYGDSAAVLDSNDAATFRYIAGRLKGTGQWDDLGLTANPTADGAIYTIAVGPDKTVYVGGDFQGMDNIAGADYVAQYDPQTDAWARVGGASDFTDVVRVLKFGPDGTLYAGGIFVNCAGDANADYIAQWDGANWSAVAAQGTGQVLDLAFGLDGLLYIGGDFVNWDAIGNADYIVSWDGAAYAALGTGMDAFVSALVTGLDGTIYAGGNFTTAGGGGAVRAAAWDGAAWAALGSGVDGSISHMDIDSNGFIYAVGAFTTAGGNTANRIASWNGTAWNALGTGLDNTGRAIAVAPDGDLVVGGSFTTAGDIVVADRVARWNGSSWAHLDVDFSGTPTVWAVATSSPDPVVVANYDTWVSPESTGAGNHNGTATITNNGTENAFPKFIISRSGGTSATLEEIRNETSGKELLFDYALQDGETLTIDLTPTTKSIVSSFFGSRLDAVLANSDFGTFVLQPGNNQITAFVATDATVTAFIQWDDKYLSQD
jgi:hypothetical protein